MKNKKHNKIKALLLGVCILIIINNVTAQSSNGNGGNNYVPGQYLGFTGNSFNPLLFMSGGFQRMMLSGNVSNSINVGPALNREGFLGLGIGTGFFPGYGGTGPYSLLHLNGINSSGIPQQGGYRNWMQYGITSTHNQDLMFIGQRATGGTDVTDAVIGWSDNSGSGFPGPDNMVFNFLAGPQGGTDDLSGGANFGREIMRLTAVGNIGIGPRFSNIAQPQSQLHINGENSARTYLMITNQSATGQLFTDGFHFGITGSGIAEINQKENLDMRFLTSGIQRAVIKNTGLVGIGTNTPGNRLEINSQLAGTSGLRFTNLTSGNIPQGNPGFGVLSVNSTGDVIYVQGGGGIANANNGISVNAGVIQLGVPCTLPSGFPNIVGIAATQFTSDRVIVNRNQNLWIASLNTETGGVGIGGQTASVPFCGTGNTLEVSANAKNIKYGNIGASGVRLTKLTSTSPTIPHGTYGINSAKVLTVDQDGDVVLTDARSGHFGEACNAPSGASNLTSDWRVGMNNFSLNFEGTGNINIGDIQTCIPGSSSPARLWLRNSFGFPNPTTGLRVDNVGLIGSYAAYFGNGDVFTDQNFVNLSGVVTGSDKKIKKNINTINKSIDIINKLRPVSFNYDNTIVPQFVFNNSTNYGLIAQEVSNVLPDLVHSIKVFSRLDSSGNKIGADITLLGLNYTEIIPFLIGGVQELDATQKNMQIPFDKVASLERLVKEQQSTIDTLKTTLSKQETINVEVQQQLAMLLSKINKFSPKQNIEKVN